MLLAVTYVLHGQKYTLESETQKSKYNDLIVRIDVSVGLVFSSNSTGLPNLWFVGRVALIQGGCTQLLCPVASWAAPRHFLLCSQRDGFG